MISHLWADNNIITDLIFPSVVGDQLSLVYVIYVQCISRVYFFNIKQG